MSIIKPFGKFPDTNRKKHFNTLPNYSKGQFQNLIDTPALAEDKKMVSVLWEFMGKYPDTFPKQAIPFVHTDIKNLSVDDDVLIWFGHSSYFIQTDKRRFLIDPVFSGSASPIKGSVKAFPGTNHYQASDFDHIDVLFISHDHWDHLDYSTIKQLKNKVDKVVCGLGVAQHFEYWGWDKNKIIEKNWYESVELFAGFEVTVTPARHFSGRLFSRNISLWVSYVLQTPSKKLFLGGDSGYGPHFAEIGKQFGAFDLAILECGQYNKNWPYIHSLPQEIITEVQELQAKHFMPVHHSKFKLAQHAWYEPLEAVSSFAKAANIPVTTPKIGEVVPLNNLNITWEEWWKL